MNDIPELKQYIGAHAVSLGITRHQAILDRIEHDGTGPGSWVFEWSRAAEALEADGELLAAAQHYTMARFPFVDGNARRDALENAVRTLDEWTIEQPAVRLRELPLASGTLKTWATGLDSSDRRPLLLVSGGIVSTKEQWAPVLPVAIGLGIAGVAIELPGVGENTRTWTADSWRILPEILDALADVADVEHTIVMAMSFSGQLALRAAPHDPRIRGIVTAGAPVHGPFADPAWQARLPKVTLDTLAHLSRTEPAGLADALRPWALTTEELAAVDVPVHYVASTRDEIIPVADVDLLRAHLRDLHLLEHDDVHGAPAHAAQTRGWLIEAISGLVPARH
jgi:esterase FrsA